MKKLLLALSFLLVGTNVYPAVQAASVGVPVTTFSAVDLAAPAGVFPTDYSLYIGNNGASTLTWQTIYSAAPTSVTVLLQASTDCSTFATIDTSTNTAGEIRSVFGSWRCVRINNSAANGAGKTLTVKFIYASGRMVSIGGGNIYPGGNFGGSVNLPSASTFSWNNDTFLQRDAANTLALRNGGTLATPVPQSFNLYNFCDGTNCATGYEVATIGWAANALFISTSFAGTGVAAPIYLAPGGAVPATYSSGLFIPSVDDSYTLGVQGFAWKYVYAARAILGSKTKALTEGAATAVTQIAVPQTAGANFADALIHWAVYASDGTDSQLRKGDTYLSAVNKAGTEACAVSDVGTSAFIQSGAATTLTCTTSCIVGLTDAVQFALNCTSSLTQTTLNALVRPDMMQPNSVVPQ